MDFPSTWSIIKAAGFTSYLLLFISVSLGALRSVKLFSGKTKGVMLVIHQLTGWIGFLLGLLHGLVLSADTYIHFSWIEIFIPFTSSYKPMASGLGTIALYLAFIVLVSSDVLKRIGRKTWRIIHYLAFPLFVLSLIHGLLAGYDSSKLWVQLLYAGTFLVFVAATLFRPKTARVVQ